MSGQTNPGSDQTSGPAAGSAPITQPSRGIALEYKAFVRSFMKGDSAGVLFLLASCYYPTTGFTIFFQENAGKYQLMEQPPTGIVMNLYTYCAACWPTKGVSFESDNVPEHVTVVDAQGEHLVEVRRWA